MSVGNGTGPALRIRAPEYAAPGLPYTSVIAPAAMLTVSVPGLFSPLRLYVTDCELLIVNPLTEPALSVRLLLAIDDVANGSLNCTVRDVSGSVTVAPLAGVVELGAITTAS